MVPLASLVATGKDEGRRVGPDATREDDGTGGGGGFVRGVELGESDGFRGEDGDAGEGGVGRDAGVAGAIDTGSKVEVAAGSTAGGGGSGPVRGGGSPGSAVGMRVRFAAGDGAIGCATARGWAGRGSVGAGRADRKSVV